MSAPKSKENPKPNLHQPLIPYPSHLQKDKFQALENPTGRADYFVYRIDIVDFLCDKFPIENNSLSGNPTPSSNFVVESLSLFTIPYEDSDSLVEETDTLLSHFDNSLPEYETFSFDIEEKSSGSTTTHFDFSLPEYDSFIFDLSIEPLPHADRSDLYHEEIADELAHIISSPDIELNDFRLLLSDCDSSLSKEFFEIDLLVSFPLGNEDIIFDPEIIIEGVQFQRFQIPLKFFSTISFESYPLFFTEHPEIDTLTSFSFRNEGKVFNLGILISKGFHSRHSLGLSHRDSEAFKINKKI
ncbi:hypothetical protein Tco_1242397 [Tanacetum coccineum]